MSEIPADIMDAAEDAFIEALNAPSQDDIKIIARAILAEREAEHERCNKIIRGAWGSGLSIEAFKAALSAHSTAPEQGE